jgi:flavin reductase (DIM6/NTAB) family NADH-FMN oxidoreductase RutF
MTESSLQRAREAAGSTVPGLFVLTASHEGKRSGVVVKSVAWAADEPLLLAAFVRRGHWIEPIIRDSRRFALCRVDDAASPQSVLLLKRFAETSRPREGDPFDGVETMPVLTGAPTLARSGLVFDCEVHRHFDLEADHELYVGLVRAVRAQSETFILEVKPAPARP